MKKLIAILTIAIVLVGAVFADPAPVNGSDSNGSAAIDVKCVIGEQHPTFQLLAKTITTQATGDNGDVLFSDVAAENPTKGQVTLTTNYLLDASANIVFAVMQTNKSRSTANYTLGISATDLKLDNYAAVGTENLDTDEFFAVTLSEVAAASSYGASSTNGLKITPASVSTANGTSSSSYAADYDGKVIDGSTTDVEIATFKATWAQKANAVAGSYSATVTLTITATN